MFPWFFLFLFFLGGAAHADTEFSENLTDDSQEEFEQGTLDALHYSGGGVTVVSGSASRGGIPLPDEQANSWADMSENELLLHMDDDSETAYADTSGQNHSAVCSDSSTCPDLQSSGFVNGAANFMTSGDTVRYLTMDNLFDPSDTLFSLEMWVNPLENDTAEAGQILIQQSHAGSLTDTCAGNWLYLKDSDSDGDNYLCTLMGNSELCSSEEGVLAGQWNHVVLVRSYYSVQLYVNGTETDGATYYLRDNGSSSGSVCPSSNSGDLYIGSDSASAAPFRGLMDEMAVYARTLSDEEVTARYLRSHIDSRVFDTSQSSNTLSALRWETAVPAQKELPDNEGGETTYADGNADMTDNLLLGHFNSIDSSSTPDSSGHDNDLSCGSGCPTLIENGRLDGSLRFDGTQNLSSSQDLGLNAGTSDFSAEAWIRFYLWPNESGLSGSPDYVLFSQGTGSGSSGRSWLYIEWDNNLLCTYLGGSANCTSTIPLSKGRWHHVALVKNSTNVRIFVDGSVVKTATPSVENADGPLYVGSSKSSTLFFKGDMDEAAVYSRALSEDEITDRYQRGALRINLQVKTCDDADCTGENFSGPDGTADSYYSELTNDTTGFPTLEISGMTANRYLQYRAVLTSHDSSTYPSLLSVSLAYQAGATESAETTESTETTDPTGNNNTPDENAEEDNANAAGEDDSADPVDNEENDVEENAEEADTSGTDTGETDTEEEAEDSIDDTETQNPAANPSSGGGCSLNVTAANGNPIIAMYLPAALFLLVLRKKCSHRERYVDNSTDRRDFFPFKSFNPPFHKIDFPI